MSTPASDPEPYRFRLGPAECDLTALTLSVDGHVQRLEPRLAGVLSVLIQHRGDAVSRDTLLALVWEEDGSDEALTQAISRLRKALGDKSLIETVPRVGYRLTQNPHPLGHEHEPASVASAPSAFVGQSLIKAIKHFQSFGTALLAGILAAMMVAIWFSREREQEQEFEVFEPDAGEVEFIPQSPDSRRH